MLRKKITVKNVFKYAFDGGIEWIVTEKANFPPTRSSEHICSRARGHGGRTVSWGGCKRIYGIVDKKSRNANTKRNTAGPTDTWMSQRRDEPTHGTDRTEKWEVSIRKKQENTRNMQPCDCGQLADCAVSRGSGGLHSAALGGARSVQACDEANCHKWRSLCDDRERFRDGRGKISADMLLMTGVHIENNQSIVAGIWILVIWTYLSSLLGGNRSGGWTNKGRRSNSTNGCLKNRRTTVHCNDFTDYHSKILFKTPCALFRLQLWIRNYLQFWVEFVKFWEKKCFSSRPRLKFCTSVSLKTSHGLTFSIETNHLTAGAVYRHRPLLTENPWCQQTAAPQFTSKLFPISYSLFPLSLVWHGLWTSLCNCLLL